MLSVFFRRLDFFVEWKIIDGYNFGGIYGGYRLKFRCGLIFGGILYK